MSHSQFRRIKTYTETCMDESLRQAYDYWQDQPGSIRREAHTEVCAPQHRYKLSSTWVNSRMQTHPKAKFCFRFTDYSFQACSDVCMFAIRTKLALRKNTRLRDYSSRSLSVAGIEYVKRTNTSSLTRPGTNPDFISLPPFSNDPTGPTTISAIGIRVGFVGCKPIDPLSTRDTCYTSRHPLLNASRK